MYASLAILATFVFLHGIVCGGVERTPVSGAIVFTAFALAFNPFDLALLSFQVAADLLRTLAELTLALVLLADAANADLAVLRAGLRIPNVCS